MLYLKTTQGCQGRGQGSETIVRQVKMSDQQQLFQMAEHRQVLRKRSDIPNGEGPQPSFMRHLPSVPHTDPWGPQLRGGWGRWEAYLTTHHSTCYKSRTWNRRECCGRRGQ